MAKNFTTLDFSYSFFVISIYIDTPIRIKVPEIPTQSRLSVKLLNGNTTQNHTTATRLGRTLESFFIIFFLLFKFLWSKYNHFLNYIINYSICIPDRAVKCHLFTVDLEIYILFAMTFQLSQSI